MIQFKSLLNTVRFAVGDRMLWKKPNGFGTTFIRERDERENKRIIRGNSSEKDEMYMQLLSVVGEMEKILKPVIVRPKITLETLTATYFPFHRI